MVDEGEGRVEQGVKIYDQQTAGQDRVLEGIEYIV